MRLTIGVMGQSSGPFPEGAWERMVELGRAVAQRGCVLITGAAPGLPHAAVHGAKAAGGFVVGISPALSLEEHINRYESPFDGYDVLVYTGSGLMGREIENIRSSDIVVIAGGRSGTLGEFAIAYDEGHLIGVLTGTGGVADHVEHLVGLVHKATGSEVLYDDEPARLIDRLIETYYAKHVDHPSIFTGPSAVEPHITVAAGNTEPGYS
jgi:hypothetical protein